METWQQEPKKSENNSWYLYYDGSSEHGAHIWSKYMNFDLLKVFCYVDRLVKIDFFSEKTFFTSHVKNMF